MPKKAAKRGPKGTPWFRKQNSTWYYPKVKGKARAILDTEGRPVKGRENRDEAFRMWGEVLSRKNAPTRGLDNPVAVIIEDFLDYTQKHREYETYDDYRRTLQTFADRWPDVSVAELTVRHVEAWFDDHPNWSDTTKWNYSTILLAALNWAAKPQVRLIPYNPLRGLERPRKKSRGGEARVSEEAHRALMARVPWDFQQILLVLRHTGTRPSNICRVTAKNFDPEAGIWLFAQHNVELGVSVHKTFKKTGRPLVVQLTPTVVELCKKLAEKYPTGPLFRTRRGNPWRPNYIEKRFRLWSKMLIKEGVPMPERIYAYCYRHQLATNLLEQGESDTHVAHLLGHGGTSGTRVVHEHYSGVTAKSKSVREVLLRNITTLPEEAAVGVGKVGTPNPSHAADSAAPGSGPDRPAAADSRGGA